MVGLTAGVGLHISDRAEGPSHPLHDSDTCLLTRGDLWAYGDLQRRNSLLRKGRLLCLNFSGPEKHFTIGY